MDTYNWVMVTVQCTNMYTVGVVFGWLRVCGRRCVGRQLCDLLVYMYKCRCVHWVLCVNV